MLFGPLLISFSASAVFVVPQMLASSVLDAQITETKYCDALRTVAELHEVAVEDGAEDDMTTLESYDAAIRPLAVDTEGCIVEPLLPGAEPVADPD